MSIVFTELFEDEFEAKLDIRKDDVRAAISEPDAQEIAQFDDLTLGFFVKRVAKPDQEVYLLVSAREQGDDWIVDTAFTILSDLVTSVGTLEPLPLLQALAHRTGLVIRIGQQLNKFIFRETVTIEGSVQDPAKIVEIVNPSRHSFVQSMYFKVDQANGLHSVNVALAFCIDTDDYLRWLSPTEPAEASFDARSIARQSDVENLPVVEIAPHLRGTLTPRDVIAPAGTLEFKSSYSQIGGDHSGFLFRLISEEYALEVGFTQEHFYLARNDQRVDWLLEPVSLPLGAVHCFAMWSPTELSLLILDETIRSAIPASPGQDAAAQEIERRKMTLRTLPTIPPNSLLHWAREQSIAPMMHYESAESFYESVVSSIQSIMDKVLSLGMHNPFWDITYDRQSIVLRRPKRETDIHPTIHGLLFDIAIAKNFLITPEYPIAGGQLDFLVSGPLNTGELASTCIEFKLAHSDDCLDGLLKQLPAYMKAKGSDFGVYCVMYFKGPHFSEPEEFDLHALQLFLVREGRMAGLGNIRIMLLDLSHQTPPSKR